MHAEPSKVETAVSPEWHVRKMRQQRLSQSCLIYQNLYQLIRFNSQIDAQYS